MRLPIFLLALLVLSIGLACGGGDDPPPGGDSGSSCSGDSDCDDGAFCNGIERCNMASCLAGESPCAPGQMCDEDADLCSDCETPDADGDGARAEVCGGTDCNDDDPNSFPGNPEICDPDDLDEDCDPATYGVRDGDSDGYPDDRCCNGEECGTDCDDARADVHPSEAESCDFIDNDCDDLTDETVQMTFWPDGDADGRGTDDPAAVPMTGCETPTGYADRRGDCNDGNPAIGEGLPELCDGLMLDEDCDDMIDEGERVDCYPDMDDDSYAAGGAGIILACRDATRTMVGGCPVGSTNRAPSGAGATDCNDLVLSIHPGATETCNATDDDCDGMSDDGFFCRSGGTRPCTTSAACGSLSGTQTCAVDCSSYGPCLLPDEGPSVPGTCNACDDDLDGEIDDNFICERASSTPCTTMCSTMGAQLCSASCTLGACTAAEACNYCDDDGDGSRRADEVGLTGPTLTTDFDPIGPTGSTIVQGYGPFGAALLSSGDDMISVAEITSSLRVGYGTVTFTSEAVALGGSTPQVGWAIFMYRAGEGSTTTPAAATLGRPTDRNGFAGQWTFNGSTVDQATLVTIRAGASDPPIGGGSTPMGTGLNTTGSVDQAMRFVVTPDNPDTAADETRVDLLAGSDGSSPFTLMERCDSAAGGDPDCLVRVSPGEMWRFGITHVSGSGVAGRTSFTVPRTGTLAQIASACP